MSPPDAAPDVTSDAASHARPDAAFYFDLASPEAYLAAEQILHVLPGPAQWQPVLAGELSGAPAGAPSAAGAGSFGALRCEAEEEALRENLSRRAAALRLQPLRWPSPFPFDSSLAMRVATYAKSIGRTVPFAQAAFRQAFAGGRSLSEPDNVLIAAAACEMHPAAVLRGGELRSVDEQLGAAARRAGELGVSEVPAVVVGERVFLGEHSLSRAADHMRETMTVAPTR